MAGHLPNPTTLTPEENRRNFGRVLCQSIHCSLGEVLDLSAKGLRVRTRQNIPTGQIFAVTVETLDGPVSIACFAPWRKRVGLFRYELGICFVDISRHAATALNNLARSVAHNEIIGPELAKFRKSA